MARYKKKAADTQKDAALTVCGSFKGNKGNTDADLRKLEEAQKRTGRRYSIGKDGSIYTYEQYEPAEGYTFGTIAEAIAWESGYIR